MTTLLYIIFYGWLAVAILLGLFLLLAIKILGGREVFTEFFNNTQNKNYQVHHIDWALVISVVFWPHTVVAAIFNKVITGSATGGEPK